MAFVTSKHLDNAPRAGNPHAAANGANAALIFQLSSVKDQAGITTATVTSKVKTANTIHYTINGAFATALAAQDNFWVLSGTVVAAGSFQKYALLVDAAGTASVQEATQNTVSLATVVWTNVNAATGVAAFMDIVGSTKCIVGILQIATDATHTFTPGTTLLGAAGITATFVDGIDQALLPLNANPVGTVYGQI